MSGHEVLLFHLDLADDEQASEVSLACLSGAELERASSFAKAADRRRFVIRRGALRRILGTLVGAPAASLAFDCNAHGKPVLAGHGARSELGWSSSHSGDRGLVAVSLEREVGVDLERRRPFESMTGLLRFFAPAERAALLGLPEPERTRAFFDVWCRKEAFVKAIGLGLSFELARFTVSVESATASLLSVDGSSTEADRWSMTDIDVGSEWSAALVVEGRHFDVRAGRWPELAA